VSALDAVHEPLVVLDGHAVSVSEITPERHRFIGTFRPPQMPHAEANYFCRCGGLIQGPSETLDHWQRGHFDVPQYVTIQADGVR
jgi:hypothetical protein